MTDIDEDFVHLARFALSGRAADAAALVRRSLRVVAKRRPELAAQLKELLNGEQGTRGAGVLRGGIPDPLPVDSDSRLALIRREDVKALHPQPIWTSRVQQELDAVVEERSRAQDLAKAGLAPTRSVLLVGPPGVGKTLAARWLAWRLERPLMTLDLSAVMSSYLGRTGNNIRVVLDYSKRSPSVLLLDEFDAIAKRRDDVSEVGELKRLVTVLLQEVDDWPGDGLLLAATNHPDLLDPAVWRRFDRVVEFPKPDPSEVVRLVASMVGDEASRGEIELLSMALGAPSHADVARSVTSARRQAIVQQVQLNQALLESAARLSKSRAAVERIEIARRLAASGESQRRISKITGVSRDTLRKHGLTGP